MNFGTLKTRLALNAGNLQSSHPYYTYLGNYVNDGTRMMILRASQKFPNFELFPEHTDTEWTDVTVIGQNYLALPTDAFAIQRVFSADSAVAPNLSTTGWRLLSYMDPQSFDQLNKPPSQTAYPTLWTMRENRVYIYPTPQGTYTTYLKLDGIQDEPDMSATTDTPRTNARWHPAILDCASFLLLTDLGVHAQAAAFLAAADDKITSVGTSQTALRRADIRRTVKVSGMPQRMV